MTVTNVALLPLIKGMLDAGGVQYFVKNDGLQNLIGWGSVGLGYNNVFGPPIVMVRPDQREVARELLKPVDAITVTDPSASAVSGSATGPCSRCGKEIESDSGDVPLTHCYYCGWPLGSA